MIRGRRVVVVMPAFNAARTLSRTYAEVVAQDVVDRVIVVDDGSSDKTACVARHLLGVRVLVHARNRGYGANQKSCYRMALEERAEIVIMVHPDYQYSPRVLASMASLLANDLYDCVLGSRILGGGARRGGMPWWRYFANRVLTLCENWLLGSKLSEFHTGYRAYTRALLERLPLEHDSDDFVFDNQMLAQMHWAGARIGEVSCPTRYAGDSSSISLRRAIPYGIGCLATGVEFLLARLRLLRSRRFPASLRGGV